VVTLVGLRTTDTNTYLNNAEVRASLLDSKGKPIPAFQDVTMTYVPGSDGNYEWLVEGTTMMLPKNVEYSLVITAEEDDLNYRTVHVVSVIDGEF
jgi:hypothetical protein